MRGWGGGCIWRKDFTSLLFVNQSIINFVLVLILRSSKRERPTIDWSKLLIISFESSGRPGWGPASSTLHSTASWWLKGGGGWFAAFLLLSTKVVNESSHGWRASLSLSLGPKRRGFKLRCSSPFIMQKGTSPPFPPSEMRQKRNLQRSLRSRWFFKPWRTPLSQPESLAPFLLTTFFFFYYFSSKIIKLERKTNKNSNSYWTDYSKKSPPTLWSSCFVFMSKIISQFYRL